MSQTRKPILCVDFDGVIHMYTSPWSGPLVIADGPVPGALKWLWKATEWFQVCIYSSRSKEPGASQKMLEWMMHHAKEDPELGPEHPMAWPAIPSAPMSYPIDFVYEKPAAFLTIDDRAICFEGDWSELDPADLLSFRPWNKRPAITSRPELNLYPGPINGDRLQYEIDNAGVKPEDRSDWPLPSFDAQDWAKHFCKIAGGLGIKDAKGEPLDEGWMITWFANALMRGFDQGRGRTGTIEEQLKALGHERAALTALLP